MVVGAKNCPLNRRGKADIPGLKIFYKFSVFIFTVYLADSLFYVKSCARVYPVIHNDGGFLIQLELLGYQLTLFGESLQLLVATVQLLQ